MTSAMTALLAVTSAAATGFTTGVAAMRPRLRRATREAAHARWLAEHDTLTGLPNRAAALRHFGRRSVAGRPRAVAILETDGFKAVNDTWGHQVGDALLVAVADQLTTACQRIGAQAFRLGGDEFVLLLSAVDPHDALEQTTAVVAQLGAAVPSTADDPRTAAIRASASAGVAMPDVGDSFSDLLRQADVALYNAKCHRLGPRLYSPDMRQPASHRHKTAVRAPAFVMV